MRRVNTDNLFFGEVLVERHVWIDVNTRGMTDEGEASADKRIEFNYKVIIQITNWRFLITILDGGISAHKGYWDFSWTDIRQVASSNYWVTLLLKDNSAISFRHDNAHMISIKLWATGEAIKAEKRHNAQGEDAGKQCQSINFSCETIVPYVVDWMSDLKCHGIMLNKGEKPQRVRHDNTLSIGLIARSFSKLNLERFKVDATSRDTEKRTQTNRSETNRDNKKFSNKDNKSNFECNKKQLDNIWGSDEHNFVDHQDARIQEPVKSRNAVGDLSNNYTVRQRRSPSQQKVINEINALIGLDEVKERVIDIVNLVSINEERIKQGLNTPVMSLHMVFTGNPGTGKTTIARMLGSVFKSLGLLSKGHFVEVDRACLVGGFLGQTAIKASSVLESALGGVLFIDEAYALSPGLEGDQFGQEAIDTILAFMENHRDDIVVIAAGYTDEMNDFINSNPGLKSRFNTFIHFSDYSSDEMKKIFLSMAHSDKYIVNSICDAGLDEIFSNLSARSGKGFGNGREVRNIYEKALLMQNRRLVTLDKLGRNQLIEILPCDLPLPLSSLKSQTQKNKSVERSRFDIDSLIGITSAKNEIKKIVDMVRVTKIRSEAGMPPMSPSLHMVFTGSPGTGKTTVARCLSQELYELGILARNQIVEVSRSDLVAGYLGQTAIKTTKILDSALGGILFIDEAYTLNQAHSGGIDTFGLESIDTILKYMEDNKDSLMIIVAGYQQHMIRFLESNPGLASRFNRYIHFDDYDDMELLEVFKSLAESNHYKIKDDAYEAIRTAITVLRQREHKNFSYARGIRNLFEKTIENQATRLVRIIDPSRDEIQLLISEDIVIL